MLNDLCFNQDFTCLSVSTSEGHRIFNCDPLGEFYASSKSPDNSGSGTALLRMLFSTSLTIIVPQTEASHDSGRVLRIFNLKQNSKICELTFPSQILDVMLNRKRMVVFLEAGQIYIYDLSSVRLMKVLETDFFGTSHDGNGSSVIAAMTPDDSSLLVLPLSAIHESTDLLNTDPGSTSATGSPRASEFVSEHPQDVLMPSLAPFIELTHKNEQAQAARKPLNTLRDLQKDSGGWVLVYDTIQLRPRLIYKAHDSAIAKIAVSADSKYIATASTKGTIIRVSHIEADSEDELGNLHITQVTNLRRGHNPVKINALKFDLDSTVLGCGSESGAVHLFTVNNPHTGSPVETTADTGEFDQEGNLSEDEPGTRLSSSEDLNENLANLLLSKESEDQKLKSKEKQETSSYFSALKSSSKLINNSYTKSLMKKLPYKQYIRNLVWEKPRRSFAYVRLPEADTHSSTKGVEIGFTSGGILMLASYKTGMLHSYQLPREISEDRAECKRISSDSLLP
ncbi:hypothetical protein OXX69_008386 [Metschnikowia pulcherrima]